MSNKISKHLESLSKEELIEEVEKLHKLFPDIQEYYKVGLLGDGEEELLAQCKKIIKDEFLPDRGWGDAKLSFARKAVSDFIKLSRNNLNVADIMIYYVEIGVKYTNAYGDINEPFYTSMERMYEKATEYVIENRIEYNFTSRFKKIVEDTNGMGWGFYDNLRDMFLEFFPGVPINDPR
jgi:hypothetical protein